LRCPGCGAPAAVDAAACDYCGAALATVTCPACFAPMFAGSRFCARCGAEATRDAMDDATPLPCPRCKESLQALRLGTTTVRECAACGGLWLDPATLQKLCDAREEHAIVVSTLAARVPTQPAPETVRYIPCPRCSKLMNRVNFAKASGVVMDVCKADGVWLDRGELQRVVDFVEQGGLSVARERERQELVEERHRLDAAKAAGAATMPAFGGGLTISTTRRVSSHDSPVDQMLRDALGLFIGS
jgi:Zn-finger nucleic acid-binding protein